MTAQAGWYPDPSGKKDTLRFWDGNAWTDDLMDYAAAQPAPVAIVQTPIQPVDQNRVDQPIDYQQPSYSTPVVGQTDRNPDGTYVVESKDATLRLVAFIFYMIGVGWGVLNAPLTFGLSLICLAWLIPMGIHCWKVYKGIKPNTTAFGVCTLLFSNLVAGILLLVSKKDA